MCVCFFFFFLNQKEKLKLLLDAKEREEGTRGPETVKVQLRSTMVSEHYIHYWCISIGIRVKLMRYRSQQGFINVMC